MFWSEGSWSDVARPTQEGFCGTYFHLHQDSRFLSPLVRHFIALYLHLWCLTFSSFNSLPDYNAWNAWKGRKRQRVTYCPYNCINQIQSGLTLVLHTSRDSPWTLLKPDISLCFSEKKILWSPFCVWCLYEKMKYLIETVFLYIYTCICKSQSTL